MNFDQPSHPLEHISLDDVKDVTIAGPEQEEVLEFDVEKHIDFLRGIIPNTDQRDAFIARVLTSGPNDQDKILIAELRRQAGFVTQWLT